MVSPNLFIILAALVAISSQAEFNQSNRIKCASNQYFCNEKCQDKPCQVCKTNNDCREGYPNNLECCAGHCQLTCTKGKAGVFKNLQKSKKTKYRTLAYNSSSSYSYSSTYDAYYSSYLSYLNSKLSSYSGGYYGYYGYYGSYGYTYDSYYAAALAASEAVYYGYSGFLAMFIILNLTVFLLLLAVCILGCCCCPCCCCHECCVKDCCSSCCESCRKTHREKLKDKKSTTKVEKFSEIHGAATQKTEPQGKQVDYLASSKQTTSKTMNTQITQNDDLNKTNAHLLKSTPANQNVNGPSLNNQASVNQTAAATIDEGHGQQQAKKKKGRRRRRRDTSDDEK